jgi:predicted PurR-regulated permease PerM
MVPGRRERQIVLFAVASFFGGALLLWLLYELRAVLLIVYISILLAIGLTPAVRWIEGHRAESPARLLPRWAAVLSLYATFAAAVGIVIALIAPQIADQAAALGKRMPTYLDRAQHFMIERGWVSPDWTWTDLFKSPGNTQSAVAGVFGAVRGVLGGVGMVVTMIVMPYYLLLDADAIQHSLLRFFPPEQRARVERITDNVAIKVGDWLSGQLFLCLVIGTAVTLMLWALGVPYYLLLGLIAAVGEAVPVVGPILSAIPAVLVAGTVSINKAAIVALLFWGIQTVENNLLVPRVMQRQVGLRTVTVLIALMSGGTLFGLVGLLLAVPTAAILRVFVEEFLEGNGKS